MNFWTDPFARSGFVENWTIFYWAWWISYAPFVGLFITRISRGRTFRQVIAAMLVFGSLGCWVFYMIIGNYSMHLELTQQLPVTAVMAEKGPHIAIAEVLGTLPMSWLVVAVFTFMSVAFAATTYDAAAQTLATSQTLYLYEGDEPARWLRVFWALAIGALPVTLMYVGGLKVVQSGILVASVPILLICVVATVALLRNLREDRVNAL